MNLFKKLFSGVLAAVMLVTSVPMVSLAENKDFYRIDNGYMRFSFNASTGGFAIETAEGNPRKSLDNNMPLLYAEDSARSNGTSFLTVRIDGKDYVFGQDYGFFGISSALGDIVQSAEGATHLISIPWTIKGVMVTLKVALAEDANTDITGNAGISAEVTNNSGAAKDVSVRLLLDTALGSEIDAPYLVADAEIRPTVTEREFSDSASAEDDKVPQQIRGVDSLSDPSRMLYILTKGWNGGKEPNRVVLGHWANLANTRYNYTADNYCDFTNYSNDWRTPDSAAALYWENNRLNSGESFRAEALYGVGDFSSDDKSTVDLSINTGRVELSDDKSGYKNNGEVEITVNIDNTGDNAVNLSTAYLTVNVDGEQFRLGNDTIAIPSIGKEIYTQKFTLTALPQQQITGAEIYVSLTANAVGADSVETIETAARRTIILPSVGGAPDVQLNKVNPAIVWTDGEKAVTISGKLKPLSALNANQGWRMVLRHESGRHEVDISKSNVAFLDDKYENMSFTTREKLTVGFYTIEFEFTDDILRSEFGDKLICAEKLQVSADEKYGLKSYGLMALVRSSSKGKNSTYDWFTFGNEGEYLKFFKGEISKTGEIKKTDVKNNFSSDEDSITEHEIVLTVRAPLREMKRGEGESAERYWQADPADGDIVINNMLAYVGTKPLEISEKNGRFTASADGLIKVVNSINVWRNKWSFSVNDGITYSLDSDRAEDNEMQVVPIVLSLDGAATMIQSIGGFLVDLKFGELSSDWNDGNMTYGIGFGGSLSLPIKSKEKKDKPDLTADQEDISDAMNSLFDEDAASSSLTNDQEDISLEMNNLFDETPRPAKNGDKLTKDTKLSEGQLSLEVNNVLFGEEKNDKGEVTDTGYIGIDAEASLALPKDLLGSLVSNAPGIYASVKINTIQNVYEINAGLNIKVIECEGVLAFKEVKVKNKDTIVPDKIEFYIRNGLKIPLAPPVLFMTGLGGGINELADTIGGEFDRLPPITILLFTRLEAINTLIGDFNAKVSLEGMSLTGEMKLKFTDKLLDMNAGIAARWIEPWELNLYGNVSIIDGLIKGGITINIADNYFYGYIYASICIPNSIPLLGGKELAGVEAAVSNQFIGANIKIIGIKFGVIYYWGDKVSFGKNIDLSAPAKGEGALASLSSSEDLIGFYGTNVHAIAVSPVPMLMANGSEVTIKVDNAEGQDALLIEVPYSGGIPNTGNIKLSHSATAGGAADFTVDMIADDGNGNGNMAVQSRSDGDYIYITVTDAAKIKNGYWTVSSTSPDIRLGTPSMNGVDDIDEIESCTFTHASEQDSDLNVAWNISGSGEESGTIDVYLTDDPKVLQKIKTSTNNGDSLGINILHKDNVQLKSGNENITLPNTFESGTYYVVTTVSSQTGISLAIAGGDNPTPLRYVNPKLPKAVEGVHIAYGGNGKIFVKPTDPADADYTHYLAQITDENGNAVDGALGQFEKGSSFIMSSESGLIPGNKYKVEIKTLREEYGTLGEEYKKLYYYGSGKVVSNELTLPETQLPKLLSITANFNPDSEYITNRDLSVEYTFDTPVFMELSINGLKAYDGGKTPKEVHRFALDDLEDGDFVIDFTAYTPVKDHITGKDVPFPGRENEDARLAFTLDTSAPVLSLTQTSAQSTEPGQMAIFGTNTVFADESGAYVINGVTEPSAILTADGAADGIVRGANGTFTYGGSLASGELAKSHTIEAADSAGNKSYLTVTAVRSGSYSFKSLELLKDGAPIPLTDGEKRIELSSGGTATLSARLTTDGGEAFTVGGDTLIWSVLGDKGRITLSDGSIKAVTPGETAVAALFGTGRIVDENGRTLSSGLDDYAVITVSGTIPDPGPTPTPTPGGSGGSTGGNRGADTVVTDSELPFIDVAKDDWFYDSVKLMYNKKYMLGTSDILFEPESPLTRAMFVTILHRADGDQRAFANNFADVVSGSWYDKAVSWASANGIVLGVSDTEFAPDELITREQMAAILARYAAYKGTDVSVGASLDGYSDKHLISEYAVAPMAWCVAGGIITGTSATTVSPADNATRAQAAAVTERFINKVK